MPWRDANFYPNHLVNSDLIWTAQFSIFPIFIIVWNIWLNIFFHSKFSLTLLLASDPSINNKNLYYIYMHANSVPFCAYREKLEQIRKTTVCDFLKLFMFNFRKWYADWIDCFIQIEGTERHSNCRCFVFVTGVCGSSLRVSRRSRILLSTEQDGTDPTLEANGEAISLDTAFWLVNLGSFLLLNKI